jgi:hypothetical protein
MADKIKDTVRNAKDTIDEAMHRSTADAEHMRRDVDGENMTTEEKLTSLANEAKHRTQADIDKAKREVRKHT